MNPKSPNNIPYILAFNVLLMVLIFSVKGFCVLRSNTLFNNGRWESSKVSLEKVVMGAVAFMVTHRPLVNGHLDLSAWFGNQEVFLKEKEEYDALTFDLKLDQDACLTVFFEEKGDTLRGFSISNDTSRHQGMLISVAGGAYVEKQLLHEIDLDTDWHRCQIRFTGDTPGVYINDMPLIVWSGDTVRGNILGFRGSMNTTLLDNIYLSGADGGILSFEKFDTRLHLLRFILIALPIIILLNLLFLALYRRKEILLWVMWIVTLTGITLLIYYKYFGQYNYPPENRINWQRYTFNFELPAEVNERLLRELEGHQEDSSFAVLFLGGSQTWGAGASTEQQTFVQQLELMANSICSTNPIKCFNAGVSGESSEFLLDHYRKSWVEFNPDLLIVNLSNNDKLNPGFKYNLEQLLEINQARGIRTIFLLEPNIDSKDQALLDNHEVMKQVAERHQVYLVDMHSHLLSKKEDGFVFWNIVHLTDYGHRLFAEKLLEEISGYWCE